MSQPLPLDPAVVARMGYDNMVAATSCGSGPDSAEIGLVAPAEDGSGPYGHRWAVVVHLGCDPDHPDVGTSGVSDYDSLEAAQDAFRDAALESVYASHERGLQAPGL